MKKRILSLTLALLMLPGLLSAPVLAAGEQDGQLADSETITLADGGEIKRQGDTITLSKTVEGVAYVTTVALPNGSVKVTVNESTGEVILPNGSTVTTRVGDTSCPVLTVYGRDSTVAPGGMVIGETEGYNQSDKITVDVTPVLTLTGTDSCPIVTPAADGTLMLEECWIQIGDNERKFFLENNSIATPGGGGFKLERNSSVALDIIKDNTYISVGADGGTVRFTQDGGGVVLDAGSRVDFYQQSVSVYLPQGGTLRADGGAVSVDGGRTAVMRPAFLDHGDVTASITPPSDGSFTVSKYGSVTAGPQGATIAYANDNTPLQTVNAGANETWHTVLLDKQLRRIKFVDLRAVKDGGTVTQPASPKPGDTETEYGDTYKFSMWQQQMPEQVYTPFDFTAPITNSVLVRAVWEYSPSEVKTFTVTFDAQGGSAVEAQTVQSGDLVSKPADPAKEGYSFGGWYTDAACASAWDFNDAVTADMILYAKWTVKTCTVTFNSNSGSAVETQTVQSGGKVQKPAAPTREGYSFDGWYTDAACASAWDFNDAVTADMTLYAKWTLNTYTVTFNSSGGSAVAAQTIDSGETASKPADPTQAGYVFDGWFKDASCTTPWDFSAEIVTRNLTLYAKWIKTYTVSGSVTQKDDTGGTSPAAGVTVTLMRGGQPVPGIALATTGPDGKYSFIGVVPGIYNLVAEKTGDDGSKRTVTRLAVIEGADLTEQTLTLPAGNVNSILSVKNDKDTPDVVVGNLDAEADAVAKQEQGAAPDGKTVTSVTVSMEVEGKKETDISTEASAIKAEAGAGKTLEYMQVTVEKTVIASGAGGTDSTKTESIGNTTNLLELVIPFDFTRKANVAVYRYHAEGGSGSVDKLTSAAAGGERVVLDKENSLIIIYAKKFSPYALSFDKLYTVTVQSGEHGVASAPSPAIAGAQVTLPAPVPDSGYQFKEWVVTPGNVSVSGNTFTMPAGDVTVKALFEPKSGGGTTPGGAGTPSGGSSTPGGNPGSPYPSYPGTPGSPATYPPVIDQPSHGSIGVSPADPRQGDTVTVTVTPEDGYETYSVAVTDRDGKPVEVTRDPGGTFRFTQPAGRVTISAVMKRSAPDEACPRDETCPIRPFPDADANTWYHDGVHYCLENGLMSGYGSGLFGPGDPLSRAQLAQILYNRAGRPSAGAAPFTDVPADAWYAQAVAWAASEGIVGGYGDGRFGPDDPITREQLAVILWRSGQSPLCDVSLGGFADADRTSPWAADAVRWAVERGILNGKDGGLLDPQGRASRAEAATMLMRYLTKR